MLLEAEFLIPDINISVCGCSDGIIFVCSDDVRCRTGIDSGRRLRDICPWVFLVSIFGDCRFWFMQLAQIILFIKISLPKPSSNWL